MARIDKANKDATLLQQLPLRLSRVFHAPRETVFKAWSSADHVKRWFSPETYSVADATVEMHAGGRFEVCMRSPRGEEHWTRGTFVEVTPHTRLVIDMHATDAAGEPLFRAYTEVDFSDALGGTRMDVLQTYTFIDPTIAATMAAFAEHFFPVLLVIGLANDDGGWFRRNRAADATSRRCSRCAEYAPVLSAGPRPLQGQSPLLALRADDCGRAEKRALGLKPTAPTHGSVAHGSVVRATSRAVRSCGLTSHVV